jgi:HSP20 family protein
MRTNTYNQMIRDFVQMADTMNRRMSTAPYDYARNGGHTGEDVAATRTMRLPIDAHSTEDAFVLSAYVPGVSPEDVEIFFEGEELTIRGKFEPLTEGVDFIKRELYHGGFERRITFNVPVDIEGIEATYSNGVLTLRVPKAEAIKPKQIKVQVK